MPPLSPYFARTSVDRLASHLPPPVAGVVQTILDLLDDNGQAQVARALEACFPLAAKAGANAQLNRALHGFNDAAQAAGQPVRMAVTTSKRAGANGRWVWFEGPAAGPRAQRTPELNAIPEERLIDGQRGLPLEPVVVLLTVNEHETRAVLLAFVGEATPEPKTVDGITYNLLGRVGGMRIVQTACEMGSGGLGASQSRVHATIGAWHPSAVIAVGIAFGMDAKKQKIGDVLVSTHIRPYNLGRVNADGSVTPRGSKPDASTILLGRLRLLDHSLSTEERVHWPKVRFGPLLTGERLVDNLDYRESLRKLYETEAIGGEMEAAGLYAAAAEKKVDWIVVKAICDWGDGKKGVDKQRRQILAAENAALVVRRALESPGLFVSSSCPGSTPFAAAPVGAVHARPTRRKAPAVAGMGLVDFAQTEACLEEETLGARTTLFKDRQEDLAQGKAASVEVMPHLLEWLREPGAPPLFALLGEYGMGKTITSQRVARVVEGLRERESALPAPLYFDLRYVTGLREGVPSLRATVEQCVQGHWLSSDEAFGFEDFEQMVDQGALVIFDGLDEVLVKLNEADGQAYTNQLVKLLSDAAERRRRSGKEAGRAPRLLISCRTQYFRTLRDQKTHFTGQERGEHGPEACRALVLLPFGEAQVRRYLAAALPGADPDRLIALIRSVHDLEDLSRRPYTLKLVAEFIPEIEADRAAGRTVNGVTLYRRMVRRWLDRDKGKHHVLPDHKLRLAAHLAAELHRARRGVLPATGLEAWFHRWLAEQPDLARRYERLPPDQLEEDLRTATFLVRHDGQGDDDSGFRFAHTSLQEFFLADYLLEALRLGLLDRWAMPLPSVETLDFLGQMIAEAGADSEKLLATLQGWRRAYREGSSELILTYTLQARRRGWPVPILHGMDLRGARLRGWEIGEQGQVAAAQRLDLGPVKLAGADLRQARFFAVRMEGADLRGARLDQVEFHGCSLQGASFERVEAPGAVFRRCGLGESDWEGANTWRARFVLGAPSSIPPNSAIAPREDVTPLDQARLALLPGQQNWILSCAFSPDGVRLLSASSEGNLRLWDAVSGECLRVFPGSGTWISSCAFSPDGARLLSASDDGNLRLWDAASGECLRVLTGYQNRVLCCAFSPDGARLLSAGEDGSLHLWDAASGECLRVLTGHQNRVNSCAFSLDSARLLSGGDDGSLRLWDTASGACLRVLTGHQRGVNSCVFSLDGAWLLSASDDCSLRLWDAVSGACLRVLTGHQNGVQSCAFSPDGVRLLSAGGGGSLRLWDAASGECLRVLTGHQDRVNSCAFSPDGVWLLSAGSDDSLRLWDAASGECLRVLTGHENLVLSSIFSPDGARLLLAGSDDSLRLWDAASGECLRVFTGHQGWVLSCAFSLDGAWLLSASDDGSLRLWDAASGACLRVLTGHQNGVQSCAFSPDGVRLLSAGGGGSLRLWDAASGECLRVLTGHQKGVNSCAFSPDGAWLLSAGGDGSLRLWDAASGECLRVLIGHQDGVQSCAFSPDGARLLSAGDDGSLRLWDAASGGCLRVLIGHQDGVRSCAFSPDGARLLSAGDDSSLRLWDAASGECLRVLSGHQNGVLSCAFSPDGARLLAAGFDGTLRLWDAASGECLRIHAAIGGNHAVWEPTTSRLIEATEGAWRWLHWQIWEEGDGWMPIPLESFGELPEPRRMAR